MLMMSKNHARWKEFRDELAKSIDLNGCGTDTEKPNAKAVLTNMGFSDTDIRVTFIYFEEEGGHTDEEILKNVGRNDETVKIGFMCARCFSLFDNSHGFPVLCRKCFDSTPEEERKGLKKATIEEVQTRFHIKPAASRAGRRQLPKGITHK